MQLVLSFHAKETAKLGKSHLPPQTEIHVLSRNILAGFRKESPSYLLFALHLNIADCCTVTYRLLIKQGSKQPTGESKRHPDTLPPPVATMQLPASRPVQ